MVHREPSYPLPPEPRDSTLNEADIEDLFIEKLRDLKYTVRFDIDTCGEMTTTQPKSWITGNAMVVKPRTKKLRKDFIFQYFKNHGLKKVISGSAQPQITRTGFAPLVIFFPTP